MYISGYIFFYNCTVRCGCIYHNINAMGYYQFYFLRVASN